MHLFRILFILLFFISVGIRSENIGTISASKMVEAEKFLKKNPDFFNKTKTKEVLKESQKSGLKIKNSIEKSSDIKEKNKPKKKELLTNKSVLSPLQYIPNKELIDKIKSKQIRKKRDKTERFSKTFFKNKNTLNAQQIPIPDNYIVSKGDEFSIWIYGAKNREFVLKVDKEGNINIPQIGPVNVGGKTFVEAKNILKEIIDSSFKNSRCVIDLDSYSSIQVTLTGFVNAPGIYNLNSLSRVKDLFIEAGGVLDNGSVREIYLKRDGRVIKKIDFYRLLTAGGGDKDILLRSGDTVFVPKAKNLVKLEGAVNKEAVFELKSGESLRDLLNYCGGLKPDANRHNIEIKRYNNNKDIKYFEIDKKNANRFVLKDGDSVFVYSLGDLKENYIAVYGNVVKPGKRGIRKDSVKLSSFLKEQTEGYDLKSFFLENTFFDYAIVKRFKKDLTRELFSINLKDVIEQKSDFVLKNRDEIYVFNKLEVKINPFVTIEGKSVFHPGMYQYIKGMSVKDLINIAGTTSAYDQKKVKIITYKTPDHKPKIFIIDIDKKPNFKLHPFDEVYLFAYYETHPIYKATISGEVVKPGSYIVSENMSLRDMIESAGGLTQKAYTKRCEVVRYFIENGERKKKIINVDLENMDTFTVKNFDEINIHRIVNWNERKTITLKGEVKFPGTYVIHGGEKLSSVIERAGGFTDEAFLYGAVFSRKDIQKLQKKSLEKALLKLKEQIIMANMKIKKEKNPNSNIVENLQAVESLMKEAEKLSPIGRIAIDLNRDIKKFKNSTSDLVLKDGDELIVPSFNDTVLITGEVMNPTAITYKSEDVDYYIQKSGGLSSLADIDQIFVIHANGETQKADFGSYLFSSNDVRIRKGDVIVVPKRLLFEDNMDIAKDITSILYRISLTVAAMHTVGAL